ncbi:MAG: hypothetical protein Q8928_19410, partial [Bacteroidota bacterium]|nr:hypothetical protein [Bacteroidota bacterium]
MLKKIYICWVAVLFSASLSGQVPGTFNYQAVLRDASGNIRVNANVSMEISILQGSATGKVVYSELYSLATNAFGLVSLEIGSKNPTNFAGISWANGPYFIQISVDGILMGTSQLLSVPYALYASTSGSSIPGPKGDQGIPGPQGDKGDKGDAGINGKTAYQQWLDLGNTGTESDFIASLKGVKGDPGVQGIQGLQGLKGDKGDAGINGKTAYQQWLDLGNTGTESNFI